LHGKIRIHKTPCISQRVVVGLFLQIQSVKHVYII
jgi:hypothetical protein